LPKPPQQAKLKPEFSLTLDKSRGRRHVLPKNNQAESVGLSAMQYFERPLPQQLHSSGSA
jgi:hypothetical protein